MRFISWNQGYNTLGYEAIDRGWRYLVEELHGDVLLLQETTVPPWIEGRAHATLLKPWTKKLWGSVVVTPAPHEVLLSDTDRRVLVVKTALDELGEVVLASFHAPIVDNRVIPTLRRSVEAVLPFLDGNRFIVGGDLNTSRAAVQYWPDNGHAEFFEWVDELGWHDCHWRMHGQEQPQFQELGRSGGLRAKATCHLVPRPASSVERRLCRGRLLIARAGSLRDLPRRR